MLLIANTAGLRSLVAAASTPSLPLVENAERQPFTAQVKRLLEATEYLGSPLAAADTRTLERELRSTLSADDNAAGTAAIQRILDKYCLVGVNINPESRVKVAQGPAKPELAQQGWRVFLVKVHNEAGVTAELRAVSPNAGRLHGSPKEEISNRWLDLMMFNSQPLKPALSGLSLEYRILQLYSRDAGKREAKLSFNVGQGTQDIGFRNEVDILFNCLPANEVTLRVRDENDQPTTASFIFKDQQGRIYPSQSKRLAPDFAFHPQIYRADGEAIALPDGEYTVEFSRGPESVTKTRTVRVSKKSKRFDFKVERWIDPSKSGWWSGDHHIHAAGCAHYERPTEGVHAPDMMRHCLGEDLKVGCNLTWGPCFDYQKQFFTGQDDKVSQHPYLLHYDVEVSGFGSHQSGHLCLLRLKEEIYPGGDSKNHWPTLGLNTLRWAKKQGAVCGPAHSGWGLEPGPSGGRPASSKTSGEVATLSDELPNYVVPPFNGIGANEYIVDVTHVVPGPDGGLVPAVDFMSAVDTPHVWELNIWYHTLNAGFRPRISGETDFPCIYGERVGLGRSYVKLDGKLNYHQWCEGIRQGRNFVSDGKSHLLEFRVNDAAMGENGSELKLSQPSTVRVSAKVAAYLNEKPNPELQKRPYNQKPYWDIERARIGASREVPVEVVVNGYPVSRRHIVADGRAHDIAFEVKIDRSSWVALRILPSSHTNPVFVLVDGQPVRASRRSVEWCLKGVDQCWSQKERFIKADEKEQALKDYAHAREVYRKLLAECEVD
ncbi:MAG: CehA/McbA family metallohydrolase [Verrucomicrobia bacterium]|nr:CehA/McbA family metallohydrolase [Verrucomicrobiota bacterium]